MTDKDRSRILRRELNHAKQYLEDCNTMLDGANEYAHWRTEKESGVGTIWRSITCALKITKRPRVQAPSKAAILRKAWGIK
jgi:hypothetical protein